MQIAVFAQTVPFPADNLAAWYSADSVHLTADNYVDTLYDVSGNGRHAIQLTASKRPVWIYADESINNQPTLLFDGGDGLSADFKGPVSQPNCVFVVWKQNTAGIATCFTGSTSSPCNQLYYNGGTSIYAGKTITSTFNAPFNHSVFQANFNGGESSLFVNGTLVCKGDAGSQGTNGLTIGLHAIGSMGTDGNISELIFFNGAITAADSAMVMDYLLDKYTWRSMCVDQEINVGHGFAPVEYTPHGWAQSYLWDDGDSSPRRIFAGRSSHTLTITDVFGFTYSYSVTVNFPEVVQLCDTTICAGDTIVWDTGLEGPYTYLWSDGSTESSIEITAGGDYWVVITDTAGYTWRSDTITIGVDSIMFKSPLDDNIIVCSGERVSADIDEAETYQWSTGGSQKSITVTQSGRYWVDVTDRHGCSVSDTAVVSVSGIAPEASFVVSPAPETGRPVVFQNQSTSNDGTALNYVWEFGDGGASSEQSPEHTYERVDSYIVTLDVSSESGCGASFSDTINVALNSSVLVEPLSPQKSQILYYNKVAFRWNEVDGCRQYNLQIATDSSFSDIVADTNVRATDTAIVLGNGTFFWRVRTEVGEFNNAQAFTVSSIGAIGGLAAWYSADSVHLATENFVDTLYDVSGNERHAVQLTASKRPIWIYADESINNQPTLLFDGGDGLSADFKGPVSQPNCVFVVWKQNTAGIATCFTGSTSSPCNQLYYNGGTSIYAGKTITSTFNAPFNHSVFQANFNGGESSLFVNGTLVCKGDAGSQGTNGLTIGLHAIGSMGTDGNISELIFFNGAITAADSAMVMDYLLDKYTWRSMCVDQEINVGHGFAPVEYTPHGWAQSYLWDDGDSSPRRIFAGRSSHTLTITDVFGFTYSYSVTVNFPEVVQLRDTTICAGDTLVWNAALDGTYSYLWSDGSTENSIEITSAGKYYVTITDTLGFSWKSDTITVKVDSFPVTAGLASDNIASCVGNNIYLQTGYDEAVSYLWSDGSTNDHFVVTEPGVYWVKIADRLGCTTTDTARIEVLGIAPTPDFTHTALCATRDVEFENQSHSNDTSLINGYLWQFGDGTSSSVAHPVHAYSAGRKYNVQLTVSTTNGCSNVLKQTLIVDSLPKAAFTPAQACSGTPVQFADISSTPVNYITEWQWTINDSVFTERNPRTMYNTAGDKPVQLVVATAHGCTDTLRSTISILQGPVVDFDYSAPCLNTPLYCTNKTVSALNLAISYVWQIDGEERSTMKSPNFNLSDTGSYQIMLTAKQLSNGCSASKSKTISIRPLPKPIINVGLLCQNLPSQVKAENAEPESVVDSWLWTIDDTKNANGQTSMLTFESAGKHHMTITATDIVGCENKADTIVVVRPTPEAAFSISPERGPVPFAPSFINRSADADSYQWVLDNTFASADDELHHTFADSGSHVIRLIATNQYGCADTTQRTAVVFVPSTDLLIMQAEVEPVGNYMRISAVVANNSPYDLVNSTISFTDNLGHSIRETITDTIKSGKILMYTFAAEIELAVNRLNYICVNVEPAIGDDETPADNQFCIAMNSDEFSVEPVKPNPADNYLRISYIAPQEGHSKIELFNQVGKPVATLFDGTAKAGYNEIVIDASGLKSGMYHYRITYGGRSRVGVVVIMH